MMDYTDNHFRTLARLLSRHTWLYTEMVVADTIVHQEKNLVLPLFLQFFSMKGEIYSFIMSGYLCASRENLVIFFVLLLVTNVTIDVSNLLKGSLSFFILF